MYYRIYQAKVLGALPPKRKPKKGEPEFDSIRESKDALSAAWETQKLFQDAICYYICALAGLSPDDHPARQIVKKSFSQVSERFERYGIIPKTSTAELFWRAIYGDELLDNEGKNILLGVFNQLSEEAHKQPKEADSEPDHLQKLNTVISDNIQKLCWSDSTQAPKQAGTLNDNYFAELHRRLTAESLKVGFSDEAFSESIDLKFCFKSPGNTLEKAQAREDYKAAFGIGRTLKTLKGFSFAPYETARAALRQVTEENFKLKSLSGKKPNGVFWYCLRYIFCKDATSRNDLLKATKTRKETNVKDGAPKDWIFEARAKSTNHRVFNYFTNWIGKPSRKKQGSWMPDLDKAALIKAAEIVFQYNIRTTDRQNRHSAAQHRLNFMNGTGFQGYCRDNEFFTETEKASLPKPEQKKLGKAFTIVGFEHDPRNKAFDELMEKLDGGIGFTVTHPTLGGWKQVRKEFCKIHRRQIKKKSDEDIVAALKAKVKECQSKDPTGFGSQKLFAALTEKSFWGLWLSETPALPFPAKNYLRDKASLQELKDKVHHLTEAINWTWPDAKSSPREFKFDVAPSLKLGQSAAKSELAWEENGKWQKKDFTLKISGMRLLRDGLGDNASSENPRWLPPLVAGMLPENPPKANTKKVSVNLSFSRDGDDDSRAAYLNFSVPLSAAELKLIAGHRAVIKKGQREEQNSLVPVWTKQRQLNYYDDEHHSLRWPCDLKKDAEKEIQPDDLWCGAGTNPAFALGLKGCDGCDKLESFRVLGVDLGLRRAIAFAVLEVNTNGQGRQISPEEHQPAIHAKAVRIGTHRLPGEDRLVFRVANKQDCEREKNRKLEIGKKYWLLEFSGEKGRIPDDAAQETKSFNNLRFELLPDEQPGVSDGWSYSDQNDELLHCLKARLGRLKRFFRWS